jgi:hypothetical protein
MNASNTTPNSDDAPGLYPAEADLVAVAISRLVINTIDHNWLSKSDETEGVSDSFNEFSSALEKVGEITIRVFGDSLKVNQHEVMEADPSVQRLAEQVNALGINNFTMEHGMTTETLANLLEVLSAEPADIEALGRFAAALEKCGIEHIQSKTLVYREVTEDDVVVSRENPQKAEDDVDKSEDIRDRVGNVAEMLDYLKSSKEDVDDETLSALQELCQPLAVIKCSIEMIMTRRLGDIPDRQLSMLQMISDSSLRRDALINGLLEISGVPDTMSPDRELLDRVTGE